MQSNNSILKPLAIRGLSAIAGLTLMALTALPSLGQDAAPYTPAPGSPELEAIFTTMRTVGDDHTRAINVSFLKVQNGWAWLEDEPKSADGTRQYEPEAALLRNEGHGWRIVDRLCADEYCEHDEEMARIKSDHKMAPAGIFPP